MLLPKAFLQQVASGFKKSYRFFRNESWHMSSKNYEKDPKLMEIMFCFQGTYINYIGRGGRRVFEEAIKYFRHILTDHEIFFKIFELRELECKISKLVINEIWITRQDFTSGRYHRDMKILKILASNSKQF